MSYRVPPSVPPSGAAGGGLTGSYPNPNLAIQGVDFDGGQKVTLTGDATVVLGADSGLLLGDRSIITSGSLTAGTSALGGTTVGTLGVAGAIGTVNNVATQGNFGVPAVVGYSRAANGQTGGTILTAVNVGGSDGSFVVMANVNVTAFAAGTFNVTCTYTDETNVSRTLKLSFSTITGTLGITIAATGPFEGIPSYIRAKSGTTITLATSGTFTSLTYNFEGMVQQVA